MEVQLKIQRAEKLLREKLPSLTRRQADEAFAAGLVRSPSGKTLRKGDKVDALNCEPLLAHLNELRQGNRSLAIRILNQCDDYLVIDKPAGIAGHPIGLFDTETITHWAFAHFPITQETYQRIQPTLTPHRLDTGTSGALIVALHPKSFDQWRERFENKEIEKEYLAWCWGKPKEKIFDINFSIAHHKNEEGLMVIPALGQGYREPVLTAQTIVKVERVLDDKFLARVFCHSGVTHQIRIHLASVGFPLVGDKSYDPKFSTRAYRPEWHLLRAVRLQWKELTLKVPESDFLSQIH